MDKPISGHNASSDSIAFLNPLRYRGYVYDHETGLYYLQSRYYDPEMGRFLNADGYVSTGQGILGNNMFAYCGNNPINFADKGGARREYVRILDGVTITPINPPQSTEVGKNKTVASIVQEDLSNKGYSFYKGALVLSSDLGMFEGSAFSYGIIVMDDYYLTSSIEDFTTVLNHEYGHYIHFQQIGAMDYLSTVAIPSLLFAGLSNCCDTIRINYYNLPWENIADRFGNVDRENAPISTVFSSIYHAWTLINSVITRYS